MASLKIIAEDPTDTSSRYAERITQARWEQRKPLIQKLYKNGFNRRQILRELSRVDFNPSFGQLVAQMTRWRFVRHSQSIPGGIPDYSKPQSTRSGILLLSELLRAAEPSVRVPDSLQNPAATGLGELMSMMSLEPVPVPPSAHLKDSYVSDPFDHFFNIANLLFLGESYDHAFNAYSLIIRQTLTPPPTPLHLEQYRLTAVINSLKAATSKSQQSQSIATANHFLNTLAPSQPSSPSPIPDIHHTFSTHLTPDTATTRTVYDLQTYYKSHRPTTASTPWSQATTLRSWTSSRLVRFPTWPALQHYLDADPKSYEIAHGSDFLTFSDAVFARHNVRGLLTWAGRALTRFSDVLQTQLHMLVPYLGSHPGLVRTLLFWRFRSAAATEATGLETQCPRLTLRMSHESVFTLSADETCAVLARVILRGVDVAGLLRTEFAYLDHPAVRGSNASMEFGRNIYDLAQARVTCLRAETLNTISENLWCSTREVLVPTFEERVAACS